jgi:hypothetical protein
MQAIQRRKFDKIERFVWERKAVMMTSNRCELSVQFAALDSTFALTGCP